MAAIDAATMRLLEERSAGLGDSTRVPRRQWDPARSYDAPQQTAERIPTSNPVASSLSFEQAAEDRDVAERLRSYTVDALGLDSPEVLRLDLEGALRISQESAREFLTAEEEYILSAIRYLITRHLWSPRLFNDTTVSVNGSGDDGRFETALNIINELRVTQRLPFGGSAEARWVWQATQQLRDQVDDEYTQSSRIVLSASVPLLRGAGSVAREDIIQASRNLIYAARTFERERRSFLVDIAVDYFGLLETQARIASQERQIRSQEEFLAMTQAKVQAELVPQFEERLVRNQLLRARSSLASLNEQYVLQLERFKIRLGLDPTLPIEILPFELNIPEPEIEPGVAAALALDYRLDLQNRRDQLDDARRGVSNARNELLPDLDFSGSVTLPTDEDDAVGGLGFDFDDTSYSAGVTYGLPLDREIERLELRQSVINLEQRIREYERFRDTVIVDARSAVRSVELARFRYELAQEQVRITEQRLEEQKIKADEIDPQQRLDTENDLLDAENERDRALTDLRTSVLRFLLQTGQLRVADDGTLQPLPGMQRREAEPMDGTDDLPGEPDAVDPYVEPEAPDAGGDGSGDADGG